MREQIPLTGDIAEPSIRELSFDETEMVGGGIHFNWSKFGSDVRKAVFAGAVGGAVRGAKVGFVEGELAEPAGGGLPGAAFGAADGAVEGIGYGLIGGTIIGAQDAFS